MQNKFWLLCIIVVLLLTVCWQLSANKENYNSGEKFAYESCSLKERQTEKHFIRHIQDIIEHFKQHDPVGVSKCFESQIPDPIQIPDIENDFSGTKMTFVGVTAHGLRKFRLERLTSDLSALKTSVTLSMDELKFLGNYSLSAWFSSSTGTFNLTFIILRAHVEGFLMVDEEGFLQIQNISTDISFEDIEMDFENLGFLGKVVQGMVNTIGGFIFDTSIKPMLMEEVNGNVREVINKEARNIPQQFPNSIHPVDLALVAVRKIMRERRLDPFSLREYTITENLSTFALTHGQLYGLATIHRTGPIIFEFEHNTIQAVIHLGAENIKGKYTWTWAWGILSNFLSRQGEIEFNVEYITAKLVLQQPANLDKPPSIKMLDFELGNISVRSDGADTLDYIVEAMFNILPNAFRKQIIDDIEAPVRKAIEDELRKVDLEVLINAVM